MVRTVTSGNKLFPHLVTFMGQRNHMAPAACSRSTPATSVFVFLTLIILKDCGMPSSKCMEFPYFPNAYNSFSVNKLHSFLALLSPLLSLGLGLCYLALPLPASSWESPAGYIALRFIALTDVFVTFIHLHLGDIVT